MGYKISKRVVVGACLLVAAVVGVASVPGVDVSAQSGIVRDGVNSVSSGPSTPLMTTAGTLINVFLFLLGAVAVVMVIFGGFKYVTSAGDSSAVTSAKNTILYAIVGLVVASLAYAIVNFALGWFDTPEASTETVQSGVINQ